MNSTANYKSTDSPEIITTHTFKLTRQTKKPILIGLNILLLFTIAFSTLAQPNYLQAYYPFSGDADDATATYNGFLGDNTNSLEPTLITTGLGVQNNAYQFDGSDDRIELPAGVLDGEGQFTIGVYLRYSSFSGQAAKLRSILSKTGQFELLAKNSEIQFNTYDNTGSELVSLTYDHLSDGNSIDDGVWHHVAVVQTTTDIKIYIDGVEEVTTTYTGTYKSSTVNPIVLGEPQDGKYVYFPGDIDELYFYPRDLTVIEIQDLSIVRDYLTDIHDGICYEDDIMYLGGAFPTGGVYSGLGVTDANDGINFDFDPSYGLSIITYTLSSPVRVATNTIYVDGIRWAADADADGFPSATEFVFACDQPIGYIEPAGILSPDCDDNDADEKPNQNWYADEDGDGYGDSNASPIVQCEIPTGPAGAYVINSSDCDDNDSGINPTTVWYIGVDADNDGFFGSTSSLTQCAQPAGYSLQAPDTPDCDDSDSDELPNQNWYADEDGDGYGDINAIAIVQCEIPTSQASAYVLNNTDCDDNDANEFPGQSWYADEDGDGYGDSNTAVIQCEIPTSPASAYVTDNTDCDDEDSGINPTTVWYIGVDADNDGFFGTTSSLTQCAQPAGYSLQAPDTPDCDDNDANEFPGQSWYADEDGDGYGDSNTAVIQCEIPTSPASAYVTDNTDCDDNNNQINPNALDAAGSGIDANCDGNFLWYVDTDGDGFGSSETISSANNSPASGESAENTDCDDTNASINPDAEDIENEIDDNCNGYVDDDNSFLTFEIPEQISSSIDYDKHKVTVLFAGDYIGSSVDMRNFTFSPGATILPEAGYSNVPFDVIVTFEITSPDQRVQSWDVVAKKGLNYETDITSFAFQNQIGEAVIDSENHTVVASIYDSESLALSPAIELSYGATGNPISLETVDFINSVSTPVVYTITSQDGAVTQDWSVSINELSLTSYFYPFNGNFEDASSNEIDGSSANPPTLATDRNGEANKAYSFDGSNDIINLSSTMLNGEASFTLAAWVNFTNISGGGSGYRTIIGKGSGTNSQFGLFANNNAFIFEAYNNGSGTYLEITYNFNNEGIYDYSNGEWHHVAVTFSPTKAILYVNGEVKGSDIITTGVYTHTSNNSLTIGNWGGGNQNDPFNGAIDDVRIYNNVLSTEMIEIISEVATDIVGVSFSPQIGIPIIDKENHTVTLEAPYGTDITSLSPIINVSEGASIATAQANPQDFTSDVTYTVTAADGTTTQDWVFSMTIAPNTATDILTFTSGGGSGIIDAVNHTVVLDAAANSLSLANLIADFTLSPGGTATIDEASKNSGDALLTYTDPFIMTITAEDERTRQDWTITINIPPSVSSITPGSSTTGSTIFVSGNNFHPDPTKNTVMFGAIEGIILAASYNELTVFLPEGSSGKNLSVVVTSRGLSTTATSLFDIISSETDIITFTLDDQSCTINEVDHTVTVELPCGVDLSSLTPSISLSPAATVFPDPSLPQDFNTEVTYTVTAEDGDTSQPWKINVTNVPEAVWYIDNDADGYGDLSNSKTACTQPTGYVLDFSDCDDSDNQEFPGQSWFPDTDEDGFGDANYREWTSYGTGLNGTVLAIAETGNDVYVGGEFTTAGGQSANRIAKWDKLTESWLALGTGLNGRVRSIVVVGDDVYVGGDFTQAGGNSAQYVAKWDTNTETWLSLGSGVSAPVYALAFHNNKLYVGGVFTKAGGINSRYLARWDRNTQLWESIGAQDRVWALEISNGQLFVGGELVFGSDAIAKFDISNDTWSSLGIGNGVGTVLSIKGNGSDIYIGGNFSYVDGEKSFGVAKWDQNSNSWSSLNLGDDQSTPADIVVYALAITEKKLYAGGRLLRTRIGENLNVVELDLESEEWSLLDGSLNYYGYVLSAKNLQLYVGGSGFTSYGGKVSCTQPAGFEIDNTDCDDTNIAINPITIWYADTDGDGFGDAGNTLAQCDQPDGYVLDNTDCDDTNTAFKPDATDIAGSGDDLNCDGNYLWYVDADGDGFGTNEMVTSTNETPSAGESAVNTDCDDNDIAINPNTTWYADSDGDGFGDSWNSLAQCDQPNGYVLDNTDCDDTNSILTSDCLNTWNGSEWSSGGPPNETDDALINANYSASLHGALTANNLTIGENAALVIDGGSTLDVKGNLINSGTVRIKSGASLITYSGNTISNNIVIERNTRYADGKYSFVGSPMKIDEGVKTASLGPIVYAYDETRPYGDNEGLDRWIWQNTNEIMIPAKGYAQANKQLIELTGRPNDGTVTIAGTYTGTPNDGLNDATEGWNLVANPYPAAINVGKFLLENDNIAGAVYIWDDNGSNSVRGSNSDYIVANAIEATNTTAAGGEARYNLHLGSTQGFFIKLSGNGDNVVDFTEGMRVSGFNSDDNFFRKDTENIPIVRLNLTDELGLFKQAVIGWIASVDDSQMNRIFDAPVFNANMEYGIYSLKIDKPLAIQGVSYLKSEIPIGYNVAEAGNYQLQIEQRDFDGTLTLLDRLNGKATELTSDSYSFATDSGSFTQRFILMVSPDEVLAYDLSEIHLYSSNNHLYIKIPDSQMEPQTFSLFDLTGKFILKTTTSHSKTLDLNHLPSGVYMVKQINGRLSHKIIVR